MKIYIYNKISCLTITIIVNRCCVLTEYFVKIIVKKKQLQEQDVIFCTYSRILNVYAYQSKRKIRFMTKVFPQSTKKRI